MPLFGGPTKPLDPCLEALVPARGGKEVRRALSKNQSAIIALLEPGEMPRFACISESAAVKYERSAAAIIVTDQRVLSVEKKRSKSLRLEAIIGAGIGRDDGGTYGTVGTRTAVINVLFRDAERADAFFHAAGLEPPH